MLLPDHMCCQKSSYHAKTHSTVVNSGGLKVTDLPPLLEAMLILAVQHLDLLQSRCLSKYIDLDVESIFYCIPIMIFTLLVR